MILRAKWQVSICYVLSKPFESAHINTFYLPLLVHFICHYYHILSANIGTFYLIATHCTSAILKSYRAIENTDFFKALYFQKLSGHFYYFKGVLL